MIVLNHLKSVTFVIHCVFGVCLLRCVYLECAYCVVSSVMIVLNHLKSVTFVIHCVFGVCLLRCV